MPRLKDRNRQIPNGLVFFQPETQWKPTPFSSFDTIVSGLIAHRRANPYLVQKHGWSTDPVQVANEVDSFNGLVCQQMGWTDYYVTDDGGVPASAPVPFPAPPQVHQGKLSQLVAGGKTLVKWIASKGEAVPANLAEQRARVCIQCPLNGKGDWTSWFTVPVANAIRSALEDRSRMNLSTPFDDRLGVCEGCSCVLRLKVHMPIKPILDDMPPESKASLHEKCWVLSEEKNVR